MATAVTADRWQSIFTSGVDMLGDHSVTVPEARTADVGQRFTCEQDCYVLEFSRRKQCATVGMAEVDNGVIGVLPHYVARPHLRPVLRHQLARRRVLVLEVPGTALSITTAMGGTATADA